MDEQAIVDEADRVARAAWSRMLKAHPAMPVPAGFDTRQVD
jgi:hypothetical protein